MEALALGMLVSSGTQEWSGSNSPLTSLSPSPQPSLAFTSPVTSAPAAEPLHLSDTREEDDADTNFEPPAETAAESKGKKRTRKLSWTTEAMLRDFGPPRQSSRVRIIVEAAKAAPPSTSAPPSGATMTPSLVQGDGDVLSNGDGRARDSRKMVSGSQKPARKKIGKLARAATTGNETEPVGCSSEIKSGGKKKRKKEGKVKNLAKGYAQIAERLGDELRSEGEEMGDEILALPPASHFCLESMAHIEPFTAPASKDGARIIRKGKRGKAGLDQDGPQLKRGRQSRSRLAESSAEEPRKGGIKSSVFARVMRLVADLPSPEPAAKPGKRSRAAHRPPVWAESRQELCEALPYYRAFQSGLYMYQGVAFGYLLDGFPAPRDVCAHNARVIISHGGGQCIRPVTADGRKLSPVLAGDQLTTDARVASLVRAWQRRTPLVLIAGSGYALLPFKLDCSYVVLGWYWVSHVWTEAEPVAQGVPKPDGRDWYKRIKVRFDWVDTQGQPWWEQAEGTPPRQTNTATEFEQTPEAKRIAVDQLVNVPHMHESPVTKKPALDRNNSVVSSHSSGFSSSRSSSPHNPSNSVHTKEALINGELGTTSNLPVDPRTGLLTPPITPTNGFYPAEGRVSRLGRLGDEAKPAPAAIIGQVAAPSSQPARRRMPGDCVLAAFGESVDSTVDLGTSGFPDQTCPYCRQSSPKLYQEGWICLSTTCAAYWLLETSIGLVPIPPGFKLSYGASFLTHLSTPVAAKPPYDVVPPRPKQGIPDEAGPSDSAGSRSLWRGWVCDNCGRANCRFRWEVWQCLSCKRLLAPIDPYSHVIPARSVRPPHHALLGNPVIHPDSNIVVEMQRVDNPAATVMIYHLPDQGGTIYHFINDCTEFADDIFDRYQREAASTRVPLFQRRPLNNHQIRGQLLAQHFAVNSGASYKYNVDSLSLSFDGSPSCVIQALEAITDRAEIVVGKKVEFNEILSVLYREGQKMSWHDDGEPGLGPIVAGLSLGSDAIISWRRKAAHSTTNATYLAGLPDSRKEAKSPIALSLTTSHGDIVIMRGREMQMRYQHRVIPSGFRVAATARVIGK